MKFNFAKVTNSRLMGTMGLLINWEDKQDKIVQYFLLDAEGLGLADYVSLKNPTKDEAHREEERLMGGLGSDRIRISEDEALFLVKYFGNKNSYYEKPLPGEVEEYIDIINKYETNLNIEDIYMKICKPIKDEVEFINYMTMRFIAWDRESLRYFSSSEEIANMHITNINGTLLKNTVIPKGNKRYISEALYEDNDGYYTSKIAFSIEENQDGFKISSMVVTDKEPIFDFEVFDEISKPEFVSIYSINRVDEFLDIFYKDNSKILIFCGGLIDKRTEKKCDGQWLYEELMDKYHLQMEMSAADYVLALTSIMDMREGFDRLYAALSEIDSYLISDDVSGSVIERDYDTPGCVYNIYEALNMDTFKIKLQESAGKVSAEYIYLYPPGCPLVVPGERISSRLIEQIEFYKLHNYNIEGLKDKKIQNIEILIEDK